MKHPAIFMITLLMVCSLELSAKEGPAPKGWPAEVRTVEYLATVDGSQQSMLVYTPPKNAKRPLLVGLHTWSGGYTQAGGQVAYARWCIKNNWHFIHPHFRGPNLKPEACGSEKVVQDIIDAVEWMKKNHCIDTNRIYLIGSSGGGHAALLMAGRAPQLWAGVSAWVPISDIRAWWEQKSTGNHPKYGKKKVIFRKVSNHTRVTIFQGGHEIIHNATLNWLAHQRKGKPAEWNIAAEHQLKTDDKDSHSGK